MKKVFLIAVMSLVCVGLVSSCTCPKGKLAPCSAKVQKGASMDQCPVMSKLNLTDAQKVEVQKICGTCAKDKCSEKACKQMTKELEKILTPEQMTQFKAACGEMKGKGGCSMKGENSGCAMKAQKSGCCMKAPAAEAK